MGLYEYTEILENINIIVIFSNFIMTLIIYTLNKRKTILAGCTLYLADIFIYLYLNKYIIFGNVSISIILIILKISIIQINKPKLIINNLLFKSLLILIFSYISSIGLEYSLLINTILNY